MKKPVSPGASPPSKTVTLNRSLTHPTLPRPFRIYGGKAVAAAGALVSLGLMFSMPAGSWWRLGLWLLVGIVIYFSYAYYSGRLLGRGVD